MKTLALFCLLALPALAADTAIVGNVVGVHDGDKRYALLMKR